MHVIGQRLGISVRIVRIKHDALRFVLWSLWFPVVVVEFLVRGVLFESYRPHAGTLAFLASMYWIGVDGVFVET